MLTLTGPDLRVDQIEFAPLTDGSRPLSGHPIFLKADIAVNGRFPVGNIQVSPQTGTSALVGTRATAGTFLDPLRATA